VIGGVRARALHLAADDEPIAVDGGHRDGDDRGLVLEIGLEALDDLFLELDRGSPRGLQIAHQRHRDRSVRPDDGLGRQLGVPPHGDAEDVRWTERELSLAGIGLLRIVVRPVGGGAARGHRQERERQD